MNTIEHIASLRSMGFSPSEIVELARLGQLAPNKPAPAPKQDAPKGQRLSATSAAKADSAPRNHGAVAKTHAGTLVHLRKLVAGRAQLVNPRDRKMGETEADYRAHVFGISQHDLRHAEMMGQAAFERAVKADGKVTSAAIAAKGEAYYKRVASAQ